MVAGAPVPGVVPPVASTGPTWNELSPVIVPSNSTVAPVSSTAVQVNVVPSSVEDGS